MAQDINDRIKMLRESSGLTQEAFGAKIGLSRSEVKNIEYKKTLPKETKIPLIVEKFGVNEKWLRDGEGDMLMPKSRNEELTSFMSTVITDEDDSFRRRFIEMLSKLSAEEWALLAKMAKKMEDDT